MTQASAPATTKTSSDPAGGLVRSSFAVPPDVQQALPGLVEALNLRSVAALLTMMARHSPQVVAALRPIADDYRKQQATRVSRKALTEKLRNLDDATVTRLLELAEKEAALAGEDK